jgi:hypothetical protein
MKNDKAIATIRQECSRQGERLDRVLGDSVVCVFLISEAGLSLEEATASVSSLTKDCLG